MERSIGDLKIERGETGFIVFVFTEIGVPDKKWAFETTQSLTEFVASWADKDDEDNRLGE